MVAFSQSDRDIALIPQLNFGQIDIHALPNSVSFLEKHISKGYQYFGAAHIHSVRVQNIFIFTCALKPETSISRPPVIVWQLWYQIIFKGKTYISTLMMVSIIDFIYTLEKILINLTHCSPELIKEKLNGVS